MADKNKPETWKELDKKVDVMSTSDLIVLAADTARQLIDATKGVLDAQRPNQKDPICTEFLVASGVSDYYENKLYDITNLRKNEGTLTQEEEKNIGSVARLHIKMSPFVNNAKEICSKPPEDKPERAPERQRPTIPYSPHRIDI
ncbi:MAG: hypothetical protein JNL76_06780 [Alphaproteobacteria bacterium]|nr:hypothetical protein [Alphaproteobacteria bacterium]